MINLTNLILVNVFWAILTCAAFILSFQFDDRIPDYRYGATWWPRCIIFAIIFFVLIQLVIDFFQFRRGKILAQPPSQNPGLEDSKNSDRILSTNLRKFFTFCIPILYIFLMPRMGYYIVTPFFISGYMILLGERRMLHLLGTMFIIYCINIIVFTKLLFVPLPVGIWPGFYEINARFVALLQ